MTQLASAIVSLGVKLLPQQERRRYAEELDSDLRSQPAWGRLVYAVSVVFGMPRLRWEILRSIAGSGGALCFIGQHLDRTFHPNPEASWVISRECERCHRIRDPRQYEPRRRVNDLRAWYSADRGS